MTNTYPTENQARKGVWPAKVSLKEGGIAVIVTQTVEGQALHYLTGRFGTNYDGTCDTPSGRVFLGEQGSCLLQVSLQNTLGSV